MDYQMEELLPMGKMCRLEDVTCRGRKDNSQSMKMCGTKREPAAEQTARQD